MAGRRPATEAVIGYAYGHRFAERAAYDWSCETSIYLAQAVHRQGVGRALYEQLLGALAARGYRRAFAGDNAPKRREHRPAPRLRVSRMPAVTAASAGRTDAWHDVVWMQHDLQAVDIDPPPPISG